jgi:hypothetical protein
MAEITIDFWRDDYVDGACLEYSYVPEGKRRTLLLKPGQQEASQTDTVPDDLEASQVQVYTLTNNGQPGHVAVSAGSAICLSRGQRAGERAARADGRCWHGYLLRLDRRQRLRSARCVFASVPSGVW